MEVTGKSTHQSNTTSQTEVTSQFIRPAKCQNNSHLFQIPAEVRSVILYELLYSVNPLHNASAMEESDLFLASRRRKRPTRRAFTFYTSILQTCQQIYHEGCHILYKKNTLSIYVGLQGISQVTILERRIRLWPYSAHTFQEAFDELEKEQVQDELVYTTTLRSIPQILQRMDKVQLTVIACQKVRTQLPDRTLYDFCHIMRKALCGKSIDVRLIQPWSPDCLCAFSILRCQEFVIRSWKTDQDNHFRWMVEDHYFCERITSSQHVHNTVEAYDALAPHLEQLSRKDSRRSVLDALKKLHEESFLFDAASFSRALEELLTLLEEGYENSLNMHKDVKWQREALDNAWHFTAAT